METNRNTSSSASGGYIGAEALLSCMGSKSDFPALSNNIIEINKAATSESESVGKLAQIILKDFALTNKLLKLVNTVTYSQFGGNINTISKAVFITGIDTVRNIAMTLTLLEFLQNKNQAAELKEEIIFALFAGEVAAQLSSGQQHEFAEEEKITSMFHSLGKLLVTFYCFEESQKIARMAVEHRLSDEQASHKLLGISYNNLGINVAKSWSFPKRMIAEMRKLEAGKVKKPHGTLDRLSLVANLANELSHTASTMPAQTRHDAMRQLCARYGDAKPDISAQILLEALKNGVIALTEKSEIFELNASESPLLKRICAFIGHVGSGNSSANAPTALKEFDITPSMQQAIEEVTISDEEAEQRSPEYMLSSGIQDVTSTLMGEYKLNDVLYMVLETVHRSLGFDRTLIFIRDAKKGRMVARFGLGNGADAIIPSCHFPLAFEPDVFHLALEQGKDILIADTQAGDVASKIPSWHRESANAHGFLVMPIIAKGQAFGLLYSDVIDERNMQITKQQLIMLRTLRNQLVLAFMQKL